MLGARGCQCEVITNVCGERIFFLDAFDKTRKEKAIVAKKTSSSVVLALHVTRIVDALGAPYEMKLARCFRFPLGVQGAIQDAGLGHVEVMRWGNLAHLGDLPVCGS